MNVLLVPLSVINCDHDKSLSVSVYTDGYLSWFANNERGRERERERELTECNSLGVEGRNLPTTTYHQHTRSWRARKGLISCISSPRVESSVDISYPGKAGVACCNYPVHSQSSLGHCC